MDIMARLSVLQQQIVQQFGGKVDIYYRQHYGLLAVPHGAPLHPNNVIFAFPEEAIVFGF